MHFLQQKNLKTRGHKIACETTLDRGKRKTMACCSKPPPEPSNYETANSYFCAKRGCRLSLELLSAFATLLPLMIVVYISAGGTGDECSASCFNDATDKCCVKSSGVCNGQCFCTEGDSDDYFCEDIEKMGPGTVLLFVGIFVFGFCCIGCCHLPQYRADKEEWLAYHHQQQRSIQNNENEYDPAEAVATEEEEVPVVKVSSDNQGKRNASTNKDQPPAATPRRTNNNNQPPKVLPRDASSTEAEEIEC